VWFHIENEANSHLTTIVLAPRSLNVIAMYIIFFSIGFSISVIPNHLYQLNKDDNDITISRVDHKQANWKTSLTQAYHTLQDKDSPLFLVSER